jgi:mannose-6-phosphate isomerase-like protein (cupin superfamily)
MGRCSGKERSMTIVLVQPGEGREVPRFFGERTVVKAGSGGTRGAYAIRENEAPAGYGGVPFHIHREGEEAFFVLDGELTVFDGDRPLTAAAGTFVLIPRGTVHTIANRGTVPVRWLTLISPAWISGWIEEETGEDDPTGVWERYGVEIVGPPPESTGDRG